jgi:hypothetical protein
MKRACCLSLVCFTSFLFCASVPARAQPHEEIGIRAQGMGGAFVAVANDATATWWNPAGLATGAFFDAVAEVDKGGGRGVAAVIPSLGLSYYRMKIRQIQPSDTTAAGGAGRQDQGTVGTGLPAAEPVAIDSFGATVGQSIGGGVVLASTLKLVRAQSDTRVDLDLGAMASFGLIRLGLSVKNARAPDFGSGTSLLTLPRRARAGVALTGPGRGRVSQITLAFDADLLKTTVAGREERHIGGGVEGWLFRRRIGLRGGIAANTVGTSSPFVSGGVSVGLRSTVFVDAAATPEHDDTPMRWGVDLRVAF